MTKVTDSKVSLDEKKLSSTIEDYLSFIYVLERDGEPVSNARLAMLVGVTPPTVTNTIKRMARDGLISVQDNRVRLTETGWELARRVMRRHMLTEWMMARMLPWSKLHSEAHNLEHAISSLAETALGEELNNPETCPHGNPLPGCEGTVSTWEPLINIPVGERVIIRRIHELAEEDSELLAFFESVGIMPESSAEVLAVLPFNQTITLKIQNEPVTLGFIAARQVFVERIAPEEKKS